MNGNMNDGHSSQKCGFSTKYRNIGEMALVWSSVATWQVMGIWRYDNKTDEDVSRGRCQVLGVAC